MADSKDSSSEDADLLEWVKINDAFRAEEGNSPTLVRDRMKNKIVSNPFVPIGMLATVGALGMGLNAMRTGERRKSQLMMRARVICQGLTIVAILVGIAVGAGAATGKKTQ